MERAEPIQQRPRPLAKRWFEKGKRLSRRKRFTEAIAAFERAIAFSPRYADAHNGLGVARDYSGDSKGAELSYRRAIRMDPGHAKAQNNLGTLHYVRNRLDLAMRACRRAIGLNPRVPKFRLNLAVSQLLSGDLAAGFRNYEYRWAVGQPWTGRAPRKAWDGRRPLAGKSILLHSEQGFGDMMQFVRFVPRVTGLGARVHLEARTPLRRLFKTSFPQVKSIRTVGRPLPKCDEYCSVPSLAYAFGIEFATIPSEIPYLKAPGRCRWRGLDRKSAVPRIGIAWSGSVGHDDDRNRSIPFARFREIFRRSEARLYSLQTEVRDRDRADFDASPGVTHFMDQIRDFADTAAIIEAMDLVVSVDTAVAHLAGALAKPVWILLPFAPDWRWLLGRTDNPWYPTARLFRQPRAGDWASVFADVRSALDEALANMAAARKVGVPAGTNTRRFP
jgi:hypothetical protein